MGIFPNTDGLSLLKVYVDRYRLELQKLVGQN